MEKPPRRAFRLAFSLRTLFVAMTLFGIWLGWQVHGVRTRKQIVEEIKQANGTDDFRFWGLEWLEKSDPDNREGIQGTCEYARVSFIRRLLGDETCVAIEIPGALAPKLAERVEIAFPETALVVYDPTASEEKVIAYRDSLLKPAALRDANIGTLFKTGLQGK